MYRNEESKRGEKIHNILGLMDKYDMSQALSPRFQVLRVVYPSV